MNYLSHNQVFTGRMALTDGELGKIKIGKAIKRAFTVPKKVRRAISGATEKLFTAPLKRLKKANLGDWITKGYVGIVDPKTGKIMEQYVTPALIAASAALPGGTAISAAWGAAYGMAMKKSIPNATAPIEETQYIEEPEAAPAAPEKSLDIFSRPLSSAKTVKPISNWLLIIAGAAALFMLIERGKK